jgi:hypothetical protein
MPRAGFASGRPFLGEHLPRKIGSPVKEFQIGVEALYIRADPSQRAAIPITTASGAPTGIVRSTGSEDTWEGRLRVQRDF